MRIFALFFLLLLTACGFKPLYGTSDDGPPVEARLTQVALDNIPDRRGQELRWKLADRFYGSAKPETPRYRLTVALTDYKEDLGIQRNDVATRARLTIIGTYTLRDLATGSTVLSGRERAFVSYNILTRPYATIAAEDDAYTRGIERLANLITSHIALAVSHPVKPAPDAKPIEAYTPLPGESLGERTTKP